MASTPQLIDAGISRTHAYDILAGREQPSLKVAFQIYDATGVQLGILKGLPKDAVEQIRENSRRDKAA
jgi:hypothetical protein